jgi:hypothetical protein
MEAISSSGKSISPFSSPKIIKEAKKSSEHNHSKTNVIFQDSHSAGHGSDERFPYLSKLDHVDENSALLTKINMSYMQHSLKADITSDQYGMLQKLEKVKFGAKEQLLGSSYAYQWQPTSAHAGGLMNDWTFNMES